MTRIQSFLIILGLAAISSSAQPVAPTINRAEIERYLRYQNLWDSKVKVRITGPVASAELRGLFEIKVHHEDDVQDGEQTFFLAPDGAVLFSATAYHPDRNPFADAVRKISGMTGGQPRLGPEEAPITIVAFSDFECSFCRKEAKTIRENLSRDFPTQVKLYFKDFPIPQIHPWSRPGAIAGRCFLSQGQQAFWNFHDWVFESQDDLTADNFKAKLTVWTRTQNLIEESKFQACLDDKQVEAEVDQNFNDARSLGVNQVPVLFINGRQVLGVKPWEKLKTIIEWELQRGQPPAVPTSAGQP